MCIKPLASSPGATENRSDAPNDLPCALGTLTSPFRGSLGMSSNRDSTGTARLSGWRMLAVLRSRELHEGLKRFPDGTTYRVMKPELKGYWQFFGRVDV